jgi:hypothetical protein
VDRRFGKNWDSMAELRMLTLRISINAVAAR